MQVWHLSRLFHIPYFNRSPLKLQAAPEEQLFIRDRINKEGYVEVQLEERTEKISAKARLSTKKTGSPCSVSGGGYEERADEVDVSISEFITFRNQLQESNKRQGPHPSANIRVRRALRRANRLQDPSQRIQIVSSGNWQNRRNESPVNMADIDLAEPQDDDPYNDKDNRRSKYVVRHGWGLKKGTRTAKC
ncbi:AaceriADR121WAp [[Ashbya] aceris (nom. inval.)]|nr:AaceriADR121WAp [[Ashbya] aceris (nom. inval.)]